MIPGPKAIHLSSMRTILAIPLIAVLLAACNIPSKQSDSLFVSFMSIDTLDGITERALIPEIQEYEGTVWRGEKSSTQLILSGMQADVEISISEIKSEEGNSIPSSMISLASIEEVMTDSYADGCNKTGFEGYDSAMALDILDPIKGVLELQEDKARLIWLSIEVPAETLPGVYKGNIKFSAGRKSRQELRLNIRVLSQELPSPDQWSFHLDLWQNPFAVATYYDVELWSDAHFEKMRVTMKNLAAAGQKVITASISDQPWGGELYSPFETMIRKTLQADGSWIFDYSAFDAWVEFAMDCGITAQINCYSMISWSNAYSYHDAELGRDSTISGKPGSAEYNRIWVPFLRDFNQHLEKKGWNDITAISIDERALEDVQEVIALVEKEAPLLKIAFAGNYHPELNGALYDLSVASRYMVPLEEIEERRAAGFKTTYYVCCAEERPNTFTFSNPAEATFLGWYASLREFDGMLRWSYNSWTKEPMKDSRHWRWPAGDCYMVYPGGVSSMRFEKFIEGIQDFEKIRILKARLAQENSETSREKLQLIEVTLSEFHMDGILERDIPSQVRAARALLNSLSE